MQRLLIAMSFLSVLMVSNVCPAVEITVDVQGGAHYRDIQSAIDAARDGDTILVKPGEYLTNESLNFNGKAITVRGETGAWETTVLSVAPSPALGQASAKGDWVKPVNGTGDGYGWPAWGIGDLELDKFTKHRYGPGFFSAASPISKNRSLENPPTFGYNNCWVSPN